MDGSGDRTMEPNLPFLQIRNLRTRGAGAIDLSAARGECICILGKSGSGKSVFLRLVADLDPGEGTVTLDGIERKTLSGPQWRRRVVYQAAEPAWWAPTVDAHFPDDTHARLGGWMEEIGLSPGLLDTEIPRLSTGERQRLALLRSLAREPAVLLLDEPTASLDTESTLVVEALLARRLAQGLTILMVTHSREQAARIGQRRFEMADGQLRSMP